jgi:hypothetical protein
MTIPSPADIRARETKLKGFLKRLTPEGMPTETQVINVVRGAVRQAWMKSDVKLAYLYMHTIPDLDPKTRTKWLVCCEICKKKFKLTDVEVDHVNGEHSFTKKEDFISYFNNVLMVDFSGLQILCKEDHAIKTLAERYKMTFEEARLEKKVIAVCKMAAIAVRAFLCKRGITPHSTADKRKEQVREALQGEMQID